MNNDVVPTVTPRRQTPTWLWAMLTLIALSVLIARSLVGWVSQWGGVPVHLVVDGNDVADIDLGALAGLNGLLLGAVLTLVALVLLVAVPLVVLLAVAAVVVALAIGLGVPLLVLLATAVVALSPLWLMALLVRWLWRKSGASSHGPDAKIA